MAERHQLKIADRHGIAEDDPFAELTRIMGFDPREPARPQAAAPQQPEQEASADFDIDLEKELMGEFSAYEEPAQAEPEQVAQRQPAQQPAQDHGVLDADMDDAVAASVEHDFFAVDDSAEVEPEVAAPEVHADAREEIVQSHGESEEAQDTEVEAALQGTWFAPVQDEEIQDDLAAAQEAEPVVAQAHEENDFDAAISADLDDVFSTTEDDTAAYVEPAAYDEAAAYESAAPEEPVASEEEAGFHQEAAPYQEPLDQDQPETLDAYGAPAIDADDLEAHFDDAMADVDMDFTAQPQSEAPELDAPEAEELAADDLLEAAAPYDESVSDAGLDEAFDDAFADDVLAEPPVAAAGAPEPVAAEPVEAGRESTLEDELNALLAKMTTRPAVSTAPAWPVTTPVSAPRESAPVEHASTAIAEDDLGDALVADLNAMNLDEAPQAGDDIDFDSEAFHAALAEADETAVPIVDPALNRSAPYSAAGTTAQFEASDAETAMPRQAAPRHQEAPDVETIDVPERVVALVDDLDIPDVPFEEPNTGNRLYDDLENEFASLLGQMNAGPAQVHAAYDDDAYGAGFGGGSTQAGSAPLDQPAAPAASSPANYAAALGLDVDHLPGSTPPAGSDPFAVDDLAYDPDDTVGLSGAAEAVEAERQPRRGLLIAGIVCAVAVAGGLGAMALSFDGKGGSDAPALVKADDAPIKVKPENPGGTVIPNQDNKVYEAVNGIKPAAPEQQKLVTSNEEPVDVNTALPQSRVVDLSKPDEAAAPRAEARTDAPAGKSEDRIEPTAQDTADAAADVPLVTPHKVRTMVVKPDGSLVPREDPAPKVAATEPADPEPQHVVATDDQTGAVPPADSTEEAALKPARTNGATASTPKTAPIAPPRPSDQPVDVVGEVKPDKVASIDTTASTAASGGWSMQIASQPTADSAQSTYQELARRYAGILGGHDVNIVKADIAGKGTFYRVRVPTGSRNDAIKLCESYKAAGGNCFVSK